MTKAMQRSTEENVRESDGELVDKKKNIKKERQRWRAGFGLPAVQAAGPRFRLLQGVIRNKRSLKRRRL